MTLGGWFVMLLSVGAVTALNIWCIWMVLRKPEETRRLHGFEIETPDEKQDRQ